MEDTLETRLKAMDMWAKLHQSAVELKYRINSATASRDHSAALASLRRFYDYRFPAATR